MQDQLHIKPIAERNGKGYESPGEFVVGWGRAL